MPNYDSPWKEVLYRHLRWVLMLLFPKVAARIDWTKDPISMEGELRKISPEGEVGTRFADALIRVRLLRGDDRVLHAEVQAKKDDELLRRVWVYNYRGYDVTAIVPESLVILADEDEEWMPTSFIAERDYCKSGISFDPVKLKKEFGHRKAWLRTHENPMALFVLAHFEAHPTEGHDPERREVKLDLLLNLSRRKLDAEDRYHFLRYFDWLLPLPRDINAALFEQIQALTKENDMPFLSYPELVGFEMGETKGLLAGLEAILEVKFGDAGLALLPQLRTIEVPAHLATALQAARKGITLDDFRALLTQLQAKTEEAKPQAG